MQAWNHSFELPHGVRTGPESQVSHGKNLVKWRRIEPLITTMDVAGKMTLDVGCGEGFFSFNLAEAGARVVGIDADADRIVKARFVRHALDQPEVRFEQMDIYSPEFEALPSCDLCVCLGFLHRVPDPYSAMARLVAKADVILFEWKALKTGPHDLPFAHYTPGGYVEDNYYGTQFWVMSFACVEAILRRLGYDRFHRVDDPTFRRALLVAGRVDNPIFHLPDDVHRRGRVRTFLRHTKGYARTVGGILSGRINA